MTSTNIKRDIVYQDEDDDEVEDNGSDFMSDFSDEEKRHKDLKTKFKGQRQQKIPQQITQLIGDANYKYYFANQIQEAVQIAQDIIRQYPSFTDPYELLGDIFEEQQMLKESAEQRFLAAYQMNASPDQWQKIAHLYKRAGCYDSAGYCFGRVLKSDTLNTQLWCERAKCYEQTGELKKAIKCFERVIKMDDRNYDALKNCAKLYLKLDKSDESVALLKTMISPNNQTKNFNTINMICEIFNRKQQYQEIIAFLVEYCGINNSNTSSNDKNEIILNELPLAILIFYAVSNCKLGNKEQSDLGFKIIMQQEVEETEDYVHLMEDLAEIYESTKETENKALEIYRRLVALAFVATHHPQIWERYGIVLLRLSQSEETIKEIEQIVQNYPECIELRTDLSALYQTLGRYKDSLNILENILRDDVETTSVVGAFTNGSDNRTTLGGVHGDNDSRRERRWLNEDDDDDGEDDDEDDDEDQVFYSDEDDGDQQDHNNDSNKRKQQSKNLFDNIYLNDGGDENDHVQDQDDNHGYQNQGNQIRKKLKKNDNIDKQQPSQMTKKSGNKQANQDQDEEYLPEEDEVVGASSKRTTKQLNNASRRKTRKNIGATGTATNRTLSTDANISGMDDLDDNEIFATDKYQLKDFFEQTQLKKTELATNYSVKNMYLEYKKGQIILYSDRDISKHKLEGQFQALKQSLQLEKEYNNLKKSVMNRLLIESQKKGFHRKLTTPNNLKSFDNPNQTLLIKKKRQEEQDILMKKKFKKSEELTAQYLKNVEVLSLKIGQEEYLRHLCHMLKILLKYACYVKISKVCSLAHKLHIWKDSRFGGYHETVAKYGLLATLKLENYEKAWVFIKLLVNKNSERLYLQVILCVVMRHISNVSIYKTFLSRMVKKSVARSPKFLPIVACGFLETGNFELAIDVFLTILRDDKANSLSNLSLSVCYAQLTTARTTFKKEEMAAKAVHYMQAYAECRGVSKQMEIYYNLGRFFIHLSMNDKAIQNFENCLNLYTQKNIKSSYSLNPKTKENDEKIYSKAVYNLILLHKNLGNFEIAQSLMKSYHTIS